MGDGAPGTAVTEPGAPATLHVLVEGALNVPAVGLPVNLGAIGSSIRKRIEQVNQELWLVLSLFLIALAFNSLMASQRMVLGFYTLPTVLSAYMYGRRHATLTALASILLVILIQWFNPQMFTESLSAASHSNEWLELGVWGGTPNIDRLLHGDALRAPERPAQGTYGALPAFGWVVPAFVAGRGRANAMAMR